MITQRFIRNKSKTTKQSDTVREKEVTDISKGFCGIYCIFILKDSLFSSIDYSGSFKQGCLLWMSNISSRVDTINCITSKNKKSKNWDAWMAQLVEHLTLDFGSGHDPRVMGSSPTLGSVLSMGPA